MDIYLLLARQGLTNATNANLQTTAIQSQANPDNAYVAHLNSKRYLVVLDYTIGSSKAPVTCPLTYEDSLQVCPIVPNSVHYASMVDL